MDDLSCPIVQYANDMQLLLHTKDDQVLHVKSILDRLATATGLHINLYKSIFVLIRIDEAKVMELAAIMGSLVSSSPQKYLGLPLSTSKIPAAALDTITVIEEWVVLG